MPTFSQFKNIAIFGSADIAENSDLYNQAYDMAGRLAQAGVVVVNGGGPGVMLAATRGAIAVTKPGVMHAASEGALAAGGQVLTVSFMPNDAPFFEGRDGLNLAQNDIEANSYPERVALLMKHSDAYVMFKGGTGTISEWAMVWVMAHLYYGKHKPFVLVGDFWHDLINAVKKGFFIDKEEEAVFKIVSTVDQVIPALQALESHLIQMQTEERRGIRITKGAKAEDESKSSVPSEETSPVVESTTPEADAQRQVTDYIKNFLAGHPNGSA